MITDEQIEEIEKRAKERREKECRWNHENMPSLFDWMTDEEKAVLHEWRMQQPTYKEIRDEAKKRLEKRLLERRNRRKSSSVTQ